MTTFEPASARRRHLGPGPPHRGSRLDEPPPSRSAAPAFTPVSTAPARRPPATVGADLDRSPPVVVRRSGPIDQRHDAVPTASPPRSRPADCAPSARPARPEPCRPRDRAADRGCRRTPSPSTARSQTGAPTNGHGCAVRPARPGQPSRRLQRSRQPSAPRRSCAASSRADRTCRCTSCAGASGSIGGDDDVTPVRLDPRLRLRRPAEPRGRAARRAAPGRRDRLRAVARSAHADRHRGLPDAPDPAQLTGPSG